MRKVTVAATALLAATIGLSQPSMAGGIPVIDVSNLTQSIAQVQHMLNQIDKMKRQLATANRQLDNMSGSRGLANVIDSVYDRTVKVDPEDVLDRYGIQGSGDLGLSGDAGELYDAGNNHAAEWLAQSEKSLEQAQERFGELTGLVAQVNNSPDQKDILDLQARIGAEEVLLQNEMAKLTMLRSVATANQAVQQRRAKQMRVQNFGEPVDW